MLNIRQAVSLQIWINGHDWKDQATIINSGKLRYSIRTVCETTGAVETHQTVASLRTWAGY